MGIPAKTKAARDERERKIKLQHRLENRITVARFGKESLDTGDYGAALKRFVEYMTTMAESRGAKDMYQLRTSHFNSKAEITEMLMISHLYFEMARIYDAVPKFHDEVQKCLDQFVHFSANQPYQVLNSELIRKYLKKSQFKNPMMFRHAYHQIYVQSKKCYVVTFCYGDQHPITQDYRALKEKLLDYPWGRDFIRHYYRISSRLVPMWEHDPKMRFVGKFLVSPVLLLFSKTLLRLIMR